MREEMLRWQRAPEVERRSSTSPGVLVGTTVGEGSGHAVEPQVQRGAMDLAHARVRGQRRTAAGAVTAARRRSKQRKGGRQRQTPRE